MSNENKSETANNQRPGNGPHEVCITVHSDMDANRPAEDDTKLRAPVLPVGSVVVYPFALTPLVVSEEASIHIMEKSVGDERLLAIFPEMPSETNSRQGLHPPIAEGIEFKVGVWKLGERNVSAIGTLVRIVKLLKFPDGTVRVLVRGLSRIRMDVCRQTPDGPVADVTKLSTVVENNLENVAMLRNATKQFQEIISFSPNFPEELKIAILNLTDGTRIVDLIADTVNMSYTEKLAILTMENFQERLHLLTLLLNREVEVLRLGSEIQTQVHNVMSKSQREFFLREQLKQIRAELGEGDRNPDLAAFEERLKKITPPDHVRKIIEKEMERLEAIPPAAPEYNMSCNYLDWLLAVPWNVFTEDRIDVREAARILDADHYGLHDVKERILEFLSILQLKEEKKSPIICFIGPPGVGKTSLGKSIASAMGRKFVRISLGGVRDEAEIRGHRRTYIGALPGRIIQGMKRVGCSNPVFMLDEIDKLGSDQRGDPGSALLEVLDPQQNFSFNDHYLEVDYDLSTVMFIATANVEDTIPGPLRDRMEIIRLPGYTAFEKHEIARRYLIPRQMKENGLKAGDIRFTRAAVDDVIGHYTMEAGVRGLERVFGKLCRRVARKIVENEIKPGNGKLINPDEVRKILGAWRFTSDETDAVPRVGVVTGLAWTSAGGVTLPVEATKMPGKGDLRLTGSLGDVMKESAMAAFSFVRSHADCLGIDSEIFQKNDFHIHVPDGATPKDGPSAGVTMITALVSLLTGRFVRPRLAMTGEITLSGRVTAIGGVREKVIAALRAGIYDVILPSENEKDLEEIPDEVRNCLHFHFVSEIPQLLEFAVPQVLPDLPAPPKTLPDVDEIYEFTLPVDPGDAEAPEEKQEKKAGKKKSEPEGKDKEPEAAQSPENEADEELFYTSPEERRFKPFLPALKLPDPEKKPKKKSKRSKKEPIPTVTPIPDVNISIRLKQPKAEHSDLSVPPPETNPRANASVTPQTPRVPRERHERKPLFAAPRRRTKRTALLPLKRAKTAPHAKLPAPAANAAAPEKAPAPRKTRKVKKS